MCSRSLNRPGYQLDNLKNTRNGRIEPPALGKNTLL